MLTSIKRRISLRKKQFQREIDTNRCGQRVCAVTKPARFPKLACHRRLQKTDNPKENSQRALIDEEGEVIVQTILSIFDKDLPLLRSDVMDAVQILISTLPESRRRKLPFGEGR